MARTIAQIKQQLIEEKNAQASLSGLTSTSQTAVWNLYLFLVAAAIAIFEQILDSFKLSVEQIAFEAKPSTPQYLRKKILEFQYNASIPQIAQFNVSDYSIAYPETLTQNRILTRCSIVTTVSRTVLIKVAKDEPPVPISVGEETALNDYVSLFNAAGIAFNILSENSDKIEVVASVYYDGQFTNVISANVIESIKNYLKNIDFDGVVSIQALTDNIQSVAGVLDVRIAQIRVRQDATTYVNGTDIYNLASGVNYVSYPTYAGYIEEETEAAHTFADTLTFIAQ